MSKRILFLVSSMEGGGAERVAALLSNHWVEQGHSLTLMPTFSGRGDCLYTLDERVELDYLADRVRSTQPSILNRVKRFVALRRAIKELRPDIVISFMTQVNIVALTAVMRLNIPVIVSERVHPPAYPLGFLLERLRKWLYPHAHAVVVQTERSIQWLQSTIPNARGIVIPNPIIWPLAKLESSESTIEVFNSQTKILLAVGRLEEQKGFDLLLKAFSQISKQLPDWQLVILGEGSQRDKLEEQCDQLGLNDRIHLPGRVSNLADWYERADLYVMSSRFEGFPNTLLEAMAHGLPAVSFDCETGPHDIIRDGIDGVLVAPESDYEGLAGALTALMNDPDKRMMMGEQAIDVRERFSMTRVAALWNEVLERHIS